MGRTNSQAGYTLIEIMMVVAIAGLLAIMSGVAFSTSTDRYNFLNERAKFFQALSRARTVAMTRQECVQLTLGANRIVTTRTFAPVGSDRVCTGALGAPVVTLSEFRFPATIQFGAFSEGDDTLTFNASGGLDSVDVVTFMLSDVRGNSAQFRIFPAIGQIRMN